MLDDIFGLKYKKFLKEIESINPYKDSFFNDRLKELKKRVDKKRFIHTLGVIEMAQILAEVYDVDVKKARLAALLHDWDKGYNNKEMRERIYNLGVDSTTTKDVIEKMPKILHGTTAAFALGIEYPNIPTDVLQAIINHTTAETHMSGLDMVLYIADALDPSRNYPGYDALLDKVGKIELRDLFFITFSEATIAVIKKKKAMHPRTIEIWNYHVEKYFKRHPK